MASRKYQRKKKIVKFQRKLNISEPVKTYVKKMIKKESEYKQFQKNITVSSAPTALTNNTWTQVGSMTYIANGTGDDNRIGNTVSLRSVYISLPILFLDGAAASLMDQACRVVVFQFKKNATVATLNTYLNPSGVPFGLTDNISNNENLKDIVYVLYDKIYHRNNVNTLTAATSAENNARVVLIKHQLKPKAKTLKWSTSVLTGDPDESGAIYVYMLSNYIETGTGAAQPPKVAYHPLGFQINYMDL